MKTRGKRSFLRGSMLLAAFAVWTVLIQKVDVQPVGPDGTEVGFALWNRWFHDLTGVHMTLYHITDWLGLVPIGICMIFGIVGLVQLVCRRSLFKVDYDILLLGGYYIVVILGYLLFEMIPMNYRPVLIEGRLEASYPSSTTLLVLCVMPALTEQVGRRWKHTGGKRVTGLLSIGFSVFMVLGRLVSGVHWMTDIVGAVLLSTGLYFLYHGSVLLGNKEENKKEVSGNGIS